MELDSLHYSFTSIDGYKKPFNFIMSPRDAGKTTIFLVTKAYRAFSLYKRPTIIFVRYQAEITDALIDSYEEIINKFIDEPIHLHYKMGSKKDGTVDIRVGGLNGDVIFRLIALNQPLKRLKSLFLKNAAYCWMDEFIIDTKHGEKYLPGEAFKVKEAFNTYERESEGLKCYFTGNAYSLYTPWFSEFRINPSKIVKGKILAGDCWAVERYVLKPELVKMILEKNPLYKSDGDDTYKNYAVNGDAINDRNVRLMASQPSGYKLDIVFKIEDDFIGCFATNDYDSDTQYWIGKIDAIGSRRCAYCFDFNDIESGSVLFSRDDRNALSHLRISLRNGRIAFQSLECHYLIAEIYKTI